MPSRGNPQGSGRIALEAQWGSGEPPPTRLHVHGRTRSGPRASPPSQHPTGRGRAVTTCLRYTGGLADLPRGQAEPVQRGPTGMRTWSARRVGARP